MESNDSILGSSQSSVESTKEVEGQNIPESVVETPQAASVEDVSSFLDSLSEDLRDIPALKKFKDLEGLAKSYVNAQGLLGKKLQDMSPDELKSVYGKMNSVPEAADGYKLDLEMDPESLEFYKQTAYELSLTPAQAKDFAAKFAGLDAERNSVNSELVKSEMAAAKEALEEVWGKKFDYNVKLAEKAIVEFGGEELGAKISELGLGRNAQLIQAFAKVGANLLESDLVGETGLGTFTMSPEQANQAIGQKKQSKEFNDAFYNDRHPGHKAAVDEMFALKKIAFNQE